MFDLTTKKSTLSLLSLKKKLEEYVANCEEPNFFDFVNSLGMLWSEWLELSKNVNNTGVRLMLRYKEHLEAQMEKLLVYQNKKGYYNYKHLEFVLVKSNPEKYEKKKIETKPIKSKLGNFEFGKDLANVSELKLLGNKD